MRNCSARFFFALIFLQSVYSSSSAAAEDPPSNNYQGSEIAFFTPWAFFRQSLQNLLNRSQSIQKDLGSPIWNLGPYQWHLNNAQWNMESSFNPALLDAQNYTLQSKTLNFTIKVEKLWINQTIQQSISGVNLNILVQAECGPLVLTQNQAGLQAQIGFEFSAQNILTQINQFSLQWPQQSWQISPFTCRGPSGFSETLRQDLMARLSSADEIRPWLQNILSQELQNQINVQLEKIKTPTVLPPLENGTSSANLKLSFKEFRKIDQGILSLGILSWGDEGMDKSKIRPLGQLPESFATQDSILITGQDAWTDLLKAEIQAQAMWTQFDLRKSQDFLNLLKSRFLQFFVWPDLWNFSKSSAFFLSIHQPEKLTLQWNKNGSANYQSVTSAWVQAPRDSQFWNYIYLSGNASGLLQPKINDGIVTLQSNAEIKNFKARFGSEYVKAYQPNTWLASGLLEDSLNQMGQSLSFSTNLPSLDLSNGGTATAQGWLPVSGGLITIPFKLK